MGDFTFNLTRFIKSGAKIYKIIALNSDSWRTWVFVRLLSPLFYILKFYLGEFILSISRSNEQEVLRMPYRGELRRRNPIRKPLFMRFCELSVSILPTVCPQEFFCPQIVVASVLWSYYITFCRIMQEII